MIWNRNVFGGLYQIDLQQIDCEMEESEGSLVELRANRHEKMIEMERILKAEEMFWHKISRCKWLKEGDGNTSYFHKVANGRKMKNLILSLVINGVEVDNFGQ